jgi:hypothetical protein
MRKQDRLEPARELQVWSVAAPASTLANKQFATLPPYWDTVPMEPDSYCPPGAVRILRLSGGESFPKLTLLLDDIAIHTPSVAVVGSVSQDFTDSDTPLAKAAYRAGLPIVVNGHLDHKVLCKALTRPGVAARGFAR